PVERSSSTNTSYPDSSSVSARWEPMNPAPPVMRTLPRSSARLQPCVLNVGPPCLDGALCVCMTTPGRDSPACRDRTRVAGSAREEAAPGARHRPSQPHRLVAEQPARAGRIELEPTQLARI